MKAAHRMIRNEIERERMIIVPEVFGKVRINLWVFCEASPKFLAIERNQFTTVDVFKNAMRWSVPPFPQLFFENTKRVCVAPRFVWHLSLRTLWQVVWFRIYVCSLTLGGKLWVVRPLNRCGDGLEGDVSRSSPKHPLEMETLYPFTQPK